MVGFLSVLEISHVIGSPLLLSEACQWLVCFIRGDFEGINLPRVLVVKAMSFLIWGEGGKGGQAEVNDRIKLESSSLGAFFEFEIQDLVIRTKKIFLEVPFNIMSFIRGHKDPQEGSCAHGVPFQSEKAS